MNNKKTNNPKKLEPQDSDKLRKEIEAIRDETLGRPQGTKEVIEDILDISPPNKIEKRKSPNEKSHGKKPLERFNISEEIFERLLDNQIQNTRDSVMKTGGGEEE